MYDIGNTFLIRKVHFVGIGGIGMSGIAEVLYNLGYNITGSDMAANANVTRLEAMGVKVFIGHDKGNISAADVVVYSSAIKQDNVEIQEAKALSIPCIKRIDMLSEIMRLKLGIAVSGSHGKTTTTTMIHGILNYANLHPTTIVGGILNKKHSNSSVGSGKWVLVEADESDGGFTVLNPVVNVVTNIDIEHLDHYKDINDIKDSFIHLTSKIPFFGFNILSADDPYTLDIMPSIKHKKNITFGITNDADYMASNIQFKQDGMQFNISFTNKKGKRSRINVFLPAFGTHNVYNALASAVLAIELGISEHVVAEALAEFEGVKRRFSIVGDFKDVTIVDDYAHHPNEIKAVIESGYNMIDKAKGAKLHVIMQPHRYSRLHSLFLDFVASFDRADSVTIMDVYSCGESEIIESNSKALSEAVNQRSNTKCSYYACHDDIIDNLYNNITPGDMIICMGAGDITHFAANIEGKLNELKS